MAVKRTKKLEQTVRRGVIFSLIAHGLVSLAFLFSWVFSPNDEMPAPRAVKVDLVGLPEKQLPPLVQKASPVEEVVPPIKSPEPPPEAPKPPAPKEKDVVKLPDKPKDDRAKKLEAQKKKQDEALRKMEASSAFDKIADDVETERRDKEKLVKGPQVQEGGTSGSLDALQRGSYENLVEEHSKKHWELPKWLSSRSLEATVLVKLDSSGTVIDRKIIKKSGNTLYDNWVLDSVDKASPFPAPPPKFVNRVATEGIVLAFP